MNYVQYEERVYGTKGSHICSTRGGCAVPRELHRSPQTAYPLFVLQTLQVGRQSPQSYNPDRLANSLKKFCDRHADFDVRCYGIVSDGCICRNGIVDIPNS